MLKRILLTAVFSFLLMSCGDKGARLLGGPYYLIDGDEDHVYLAKKTQTSEDDTLIVDEQVVDYRITNGYLLVLRKVAESFDCYDKRNVPTIITYYSNKDEYWVIDLINEKENGPLSAQAYVLMLNKLQLPLVKLSAPSNYYHNDEVFAKRRKECKRLRSL
jgi:hypothetical protein